MYSTYLFCASCVVASYRGNDARKILSAESAGTLKKLISAKARSRPPTKWLREYRPILLLFVEVIRTYDVVILRTQTLRLHPEWKVAINDFAAAHKKLGDAFLKAFPRKRGSQYMTPKVACTIYDVPAWVEEFHWSLLVISEQAFEAVYYKYMELEKNYKIPLTGAELIAGRRRWSSDPTWGKKAGGNINGKEKRMASKKKTTPAERQRKRRQNTNVLEKKYTTARTRQRRAVAAFNADNVMCGGPECVKRMHEVLSFIKKNEPEAQAPWH